MLMDTAVVISVVDGDLGVEVFCVENKTLLAVEANTSLDVVVAIPVGDTLVG